MPTDGERIAALEERVRGLDATMRDSTTAILERLDGGADVPFERSIRGRLHTLESESNAAKAASRALAEAQAERRKAQAARADAEAASSSRYWRVAGVIVAVAAVVLPYLVPHGGLFG